MLLRLSLLEVPWFLSRRELSLHLFFLLKEFAGSLLLALCRFHLMNLYIFLSSVNLTNLFPVDHLGQIKWEDGQRNIQCHCIISVSLEKQAKDRVRKYVIKNCPTSHKHLEAEKTLLRKLQFSDLLIRI